MSTLYITEPDVNRLAQLFYERSGLTLSALAKPEICIGLTAVFQELGFEVVDGVYNKMTAEQEAKDVW
jgi:hypothetical protein